MKLLVGKTSLEVMIFSVNPKSLWVKSLSKRQFRIMNAKKNGSFLAAEERKEVLDHDTWHPLRFTLPKGGY